MASQTPGDVQAQLDALVVVRLWALLDVFEQRLSKELSAMNLSVASFRLIGELMRSPGGLGQSELARRLGVRPPSVSTAVSKLEAAGIVERTPNPNDARAYVVRLCSQAPLDHGVELLATLERELVSDLSPDEREQLVSFLDRANARLSASPSSSS